MKFDDSEMKWEEVCPMNEERYMMVAAVCSKTVWWLQVLQKRMVSLQ